MTLEEFKKTRFEGREKLLNRILKVFKQFKPVAIHQFGSGAVGYKDEFSDLDLWFTFRDDEVGVIVKDQNKILKSIAPVFLKHQSKTWSPLGGSATLIIHSTEFGLFQVDYYISKFSETIIQRGALVLYGSDLLKRGEWRLNKGAKSSHTLKKDISLLLILVFISIKGIIRKWEGPDFENNIKFVYKRLQKNYGIRMKRRRINLSFKLIYKLLVDLYPLANKVQKRSIVKIKNYAEQVEHLYQQQSHI